MLLPTFFPEPKTTDWNLIQSICSKHFSQLNPALVNNPCSWWIVYCQPFIKTPYFWTSLGLLDLPDRHKTGQLMDPTCLKANHLIIQRCKGWIRKTQKIRQMKVSIQVVVFSTFLVDSPAVNVKKHVTFNTFQYRTIDLYIYNRMWSLRIAHEGLRSNISNQNPTCRFVFVQDQHHTGCSLSRDAIVTISRLHV